MREVSPTVMDQRFFYHSFPRRGQKVTKATDLGIKVLVSICRNGLLLVPEVVSWRDPRSSTHEPIHAYQKRICFTELAPLELAEHAEIFGNCAIEFSITSLRNLGALPVMYVPDTSRNTIGLDAVGTLLLSNLAAALSLLSHIDEIKRAPGNGLKISVQTKGGETVSRQFSIEETSGIKGMISLLENTQGTDIGNLSNSLKRFANLMYPTERSASSANMEYYRQREWRIFSGIRLGGVDITTPPSASQVDELMASDPAFFSKPIEFADGTFSIAEKSEFLHYVGGAHVLSFANRIIVPTECCHEAMSLLNSIAVALPVVAAEALS